MPFGIYMKGDLLMANLTHRNIKILQDCILEIYSNLDINTLPDHIIRTTSKVIPSSVTSYAKISQQNQKIVYRGIGSCRKWDDLTNSGDTILNSTIPQPPL